jgi:hypothetical protein
MWGAIMGHFPTEEKQSHDQINLFRIMLDSRNKAELMRVM